TSVSSLRANCSMPRLRKPTGARRNVTLLPSGDIVRSRLRRGVDGESLRLGRAIATLGGRLRQFQHELASCADGRVIALRSLNNSLYQRVTHHIALIELHKTDAFHAFEHLDGVQ